MLHRSSRTLHLVIVTAALAGCSGGDGGGTGGATQTTTGAGGETQTTTTTGSSTQTTTTTGSTGAAGCGVKVIIAFFSDAACTAKVGQRAYDTSLDCFSWTAAGSSAQENSTTRFQCYNDRLCYTQHPNTLTCEGGMGATDKEAQNAACIKEPAGTLYSKLVSGNEGCPPPPAGFACPASAAGMGTEGIAACTSGP